MVVPSHNILDYSLHYLHYRLVAGIECQNLSINLFPLQTTRRELIKNRKVVELFEEKLRESRTPPENGGAIAGSVGGPVFQGMPSVGGRHRQMVFSRNADIKLQEIIDLALRDFVTPWYSYLVPEYHQHFTMLLRDELWLVMAKIKGMNVVIKYKILFNNSISN